MSDAVELDEQHVYRVGGVVVPGVSQVLRPLVNLDCIPPAVLERKRAIGTAVHKVCEWEDAGADVDLDSIDPEVAWYVEGWRRFRLERRFEIVQSEQQLFSVDYGYAGTPDRIVEMDGERWCLDIKTVAKVSPVTGLQTAAYARLAGGLPMRRAAVQLTPDAKYCFKEFADPADWPIFVGLLNVHKWKVKNGIAI